jgi:hypothetical protein
MARLIFHHKIDEGGAVLTLREKSLIGAGRVMSPNSWAEAAGDVAFAGVARVLAVVDADDGSASVEGETVRLSHRALAALTEPQAASLGLPHAAPFALSLETDKLITDPAFAVRPPGSRRETGRSWPIVTAPFSSGARSGIGFPTRFSPS